MLLTSHDLMIARLLVCQMPAVPLSCIEALQDVEAPGGWAILTSGQPLLDPPHTCHMTRDPNDCARELALPKMGSLEAIAIRLEAIALI